jgi:hypothetical protein
VDCPGRGGVGIIGGLESVDRLSTLVNDPSRDKH